MNLPFLETRPKSALLPYPSLLSQFHYRERLDDTKIVSLFIDYSCPSNLYYEKRKNVGFLL